MPGRHSTLDRPSLDDFRGFLQTRTSDVRSGIVAPVVEAALSNLADESEFIGGIERGLLTAKAYAEANLTGLDGPGGRSYSLTVKTIKSHAGIMAHLGAGAGPCGIADLVAVCRYTYDHRVLFERSMLLRVMAEDEPGSNRWSVDRGQLDLYRSWPTITMLTGPGGKGPLPGLPQNLDVRPKSRFFSAFLLTKQPTLPSSAPLNHAMEVIGADTLYAATTNVGAAAFGGVGEIPLGYTTWNLLLQLIGEELVVDGAPVNPAARALIDVTLAHLEAPGPAEGRRPMVGLEVELAAKGRAH